MSSPVYVQERFRGRDDDVALNNGTFNGGGGLDGDWSQDVDVNFRVRFVVQQTNAAKTVNNQTFELWYDLNSSGTYAAVTSSTPVQPAATAQYANGDTTTQVIGAGTYGTGDSLAGVDNAVVTGNCDFNGAEEIEAEWALTLDSAQLNNADTIDLRVRLSGGTVLDTYTSTPQITAVEAVLAHPPPLYLSPARIRQVPYRNPVRQAGRPYRPRATRFSPSTQPPAAYSQPFVRPSTPPSKAEYAYASVPVMIPGPPHVQHFEVVARPKHLKRPKNPSRQKGTAFRPNPVFFSPTGAAAPADVSQPVPAKPRRRPSRPGRQGRIPSFAPTAFTPTGPFLELEWVPQHQRTPPPTPKVEGLIRRPLVFHFSPQQAIQSVEPLLRPTPRSGMNGSQAGRLSRPLATRFSPQQAIQSIEGLLRPALRGSLNDTWDGRTFRPLAFYFTPREAVQSFESLLRPVPRGGLNAVQGGSLYRPDVTRFSPSTQTPPPPGGPPSARRRQIEPDAGFPGRPSRVAATVFSPTTQPPAAATAPPAAKPRPAVPAHFPGHLSRPLVFYFTPRRAIQSVESLLRPAPRGGTNDPQAGRLFRPLASHFSPQQALQSVEVLLRPAPHGLPNAAGEGRVFRPLAFYFTPRRAIQSVEPVLRPVPRGKPELPLEGRLFRPLAFRFTPTAPTTGNGWLAGKQLARPMDGSTGGGKRTPTGVFYFSPTGTPVLPRWSTFPRGKRPTAGRPWPRTRLPYVVYFPPSGKVYSPRDLSAALLDCSGLSAVLADGSGLTAVLEDLSGLGVSLE